jgi:RHS repeat-associated protein
LRSFDKGLKIVGDTFLSQDSEQLSLLRLQIYRYDATLVSTTSSVARSLNVALRKAARYAGKERDTESGLDYFPARYFNSNTGRFLSPDPSGAAFANPSNPQSWNMYSYVLRSFGTDEITPEFRGVSGSFGTGVSGVSGQTKLPRITKMAQLKVRRGRKRKQFVLDRTQAASWAHAFAESGVDGFPFPTHE